MRPAGFLGTVLLVAAAFCEAHAQTGCVRLGWGSCQFWQENQNFTTPAVYTLIESILGTGTSNVGTDTWIRIYRIAMPSQFVGPLPDAWRFDDSGCAAGRLTTSLDPISKFCPTMKGTNANVSASFAINSDGSAFLRLTSSYDTFSPAPATQYTAWQIHFDHTQSNAGPTSPGGSDCGNIEYCVNFLVDHADLLLPSGQRLPLMLCDQEDAVHCASATWNGGCEIIHAGGCPQFDPVPTQNSTWGRLKSLYR